MFVRLLSLMFLKVLIIIFKGRLDHLAIFPWSAVHVNTLIKVFILYVTWFITCISSLSFCKSESLIMCGLWVLTPKHTHILYVHRLLYLWKFFTVILFINICSVIFEMTFDVFFFVYFAEITISVLWWYWILTRFDVFILVTMHMYFRLLWHDAT